MNKELLQLAAELSRRGEPFVLATVVRREPYSSSHQGDMAIITRDGTYHGWLGGNCTRPSVQREAARALVDGAPRLVSLSPEPARDPRPGITPLPMTCHSGGTVDIFIEPVLAAERLVVFGVSPVARALARLGKAMGYRVDLVDPDARADELPDAERVFGELDAPELRAAPPGAHAIVASMGEHDEDAVAAALAMRPAYLGVIASRARFAVLREALVARGIAESALAAIRSPAGLDLGGRLPEEVALSVLAEIVQVRNARRAAAPVEAPVAAAVAAPPTTAIDPVCHMTVTIATARHTGEWDGRRWYFCNPRCKDRFLTEPRRYLEPPPTAAAEPGPLPDLG